MPIIFEIRMAVWVAFMFAALVLVLAYLFPSMRGPNWNSTEDLLLAIIFALLAIGVKPQL